MRIFVVLLFCFLVFENHSFSQALEEFGIKRENLSKKQFFFYDQEQTDLESEGYYYKDKLGETSLRHGRWRFYDKNGNLREERWYFKNNIHGPATVYLPNGVVESEGFFKFGKQDSTYIERYENDTIKQKGFFENGEPTGLWEHFYLDGRKKMEEEVVDGVNYVNSFYLNDSSHTQTIEDGDGFLAIYYTTGALKEFYNFKDGLKHGSFEERSIYGYPLLIGKFDEDRKDSTWNYYYYTGDLEKVSNYKKDTLHGEYRYFYDNGQINVEGEYKDGSKTGKWTWYTNQGIVDMEGEFLEGRQNGDWIYNHPNGQLSYNAYFENDLREGKWEYFYQDGSKYRVGHFKDDKKHGLWKTWYESGQLLMEGEYKEGKEDGVWKNYWENGQLKNKTTFKDGLRHGDWESYYPSGKPRLLGEYKEEMKTGEWKTYFENGRIKDIENYKVVKKKSKVKYGLMKGREHLKSVKHGDFISYSSKDYKKTQEGKFKRGEKDGEWIAYHPGGRKPAVITTYKKGELHGPMKTYTFRGNKLISEVNFKDGKQHGKAISYDKRGRVIKEEEYENGVKATKGKSFMPGK